MATHDNDIDNIRDTSRREFGRNVFCSTLSSIAFWKSMPDNAMAADKNPKGLLSIEEVAKRLRAVPTFTIVDPNVSHSKLKST